MRLLLASNNAKKRHELERLLAGSRLEVVTPAEAGLDLEPVEDGATFTANARIKALAFAAAFDGPVLADDSGLVVDALDGRPGVHSARFAGADADDAANRTRLLRELEGVPTETRTARFVCHVALARGDEILAEETGTCEGRVLEAERGAGGFGYDPLFLDVATGRSFAELAAAEKDALSHRGRALTALTPRLLGLED